MESSLGVKAWECLRRIIHNAAIQDCGVMRDDRYNAMIDRITNKVLEVYVLAEEKLDNDTELEHKTKVTRS